MEAYRRAEGGRYRAVRERWLESDPESGPFFDTVALQRALKALGTFGFQVSDPQQFVTQIVGTQGRLTMDQIEERLRTMLLSKLQDTLGEWGAKYAVPEMIVISTVTEAR